jgi:hypothetical protein
MFRRTPALLATALLALACLFGAPTVGAGAAEPFATTLDASAGAIGGSIRGSLDQQDPDGGVNQRADEDDTPVRPVRVSSSIHWPYPVASARCDHAAATIAPTHRSCASPPRAPPTA